MKFLNDPFQFIKTAQYLGSFPVIGKEPADFDPEMFIFIKILCYQLAQVAVSHHQDLGYPVFFQINALENFKYN
jgi:hypothetical protein